MGNNVTGEELDSNIIEEKNSITKLEESNTVIYVCGTSRECQLPVRNRPKLNTLTETDISQFISKNHSKKIVEVYCGAQHTFVQTTDTLYSCGDNNFSLIGHKKGEARYTEGLKKVDSSVFTPFRVTKVVPTIMNSFFFDENGNIYGSGYNERGQIGVGHVQPITIPQYLSPTLFNNEKIFVVGGGSASTFFATEHNHLYSVGYNRYGQLGQGNFTDIYSPKLITLFYDLNDRVVTIKSGYVFSVILFGEFMIANDLYT